MSLKLLEILIKAACSDGIITDAERFHLEKEAEKVGVSTENLIFLINSELENKIKSETSGFETVKENLSDQSGFIVDNETINNQSGFLTSENNNLESGFITDNKSENYTFNLNQIFTDVTVFPTQGAMSLVQKGKYLGKWVIIKRLKPEFSNNQKYIELFYKEFENAYHLDHLNIARINGKGQDSEGNYYYMEFVDGRPLSELIKIKGIEDGKLIKKISLEILEALSYVHKKQVFHRDLKPSNILVTFKGDNVKLIDFGLALTDSYDDDLKTVGTPKYAAPEQFTHGFNADARSDIYSFGLILLEMLTGQIDNNEIAKLRSNELFAIINKSIDKNVLERYSNCEQIIEEIKNIEIKDNTNIFFETKITEITNKIEDIQTFEEFFKFTHFKWKNGDLQYLDNPYSDEPTFTEQAESQIYFDLIIKFFDNNFEENFKNNFFVKGEYLIKYDKKKFLLTNYSLFIRNHENESFKLLLLNQINPKTEKLLTSHSIYINFRNYKIWRSDWELIIKLMEKKEWEVLTENQLKILENKKTQSRKYLNEKDIILSYELYNISYKDFPFISIHDFISNTKTIWESLEYSKYYGNRIIDHTETIKSYISDIEEVFSTFYPFKNEFLLLDCFHKQGFITNFRLFYYDSIQKKYHAIILKNIKSYSIADDLYTDLGGLQVITHDNRKINLSLKYENTGFAKTRKNEMYRIQQFLVRNDIETLVNENKISYLALTKDLISAIYF
jgi:serine/threonine protein kinase